MQMSSPRLSEEISLWYTPHGVDEPFLITYLMFVFSFDLIASKLEHIWLEILLSNT